MTITQLEYILAVEKYQHFSKAAKSCNVTQPTLSMQIQKLEDELGVVIFDRSKNPIMVTDVGQKVLKQAAQSIKEFSKINTIIELDNKELTGEFRVGVIPTLAPYIIPLFIGTFSTKHPKVELVINEMKTQHIIKALEDDTLDSGILVTPLHHHQIIERSLFVEPFHIYSSKNHKYFGKDNIDPKNLTLDNIWLLGEGHCFRDQILNICRLRKENKPNTRFESGNLETIKNIIDKNEGYTLLPHLATLNLKNNNHISNFKSPVPSREVSLVHSRIFLKDRLIDALEAVIIENLPRSIKSYKRKINIVEIY
jgi:LysR family hydrogen peroxide-inducible transcriptional activator